MRKSRSVFPDSKKNATDQTGLRIYCADLFDLHRRKLTETSPDFLHITEQEIRLDIPFLYIRQGGFAGEHTDSVHTSIFTGGDIRIQTVAHDDLVFPAGQPVFSTHSSP